MEKYFCSKYIESTDFVSLYGRVVIQRKAESCGGAGIANANPMQTSWTALRLALPGFIIPFIIAYDPVLLLDTTEGPINYWRFVIVVATALVGVYALAVGMGNFVRTRMNIVERILFVAVAFLLITTDQMLDLVGIVLFIVVMTIHYVKSKRVVEAQN